MKAPLYTKKGTKKSEVELHPEIYATRVNHRLLELATKAYAANLRHGTADTKVRKEVRGGGKKPWKQKGTGRARAGSSRSPIWRGGGTVFGPHPRSYYTNMSKKMREKALVSALSFKSEGQNVLLLEDAKLSAPKTKEWMQVISALPLSGKRALCVVGEMDENLKRASNNLSYSVEVREAKNFNAYHVLQKEKLILDKAALDIIEARLIGTKEKTKAKAE